MPRLCVLTCAATLLGVASELRVLSRASQPPRGRAPRLSNLSDARQVHEDCEAISWADLCDRQLSSGECFQLQPSTSPANCQLRGPAFPAPAQLQGAAPSGVVTTCGSWGELRISGQIQIISLRLEAETMIFEDAQVEAWHDTPDLSIETGGAFHSEGPLNLTRSNLTVRGTGAVRGGGLAAGDLTLVSSSLRVLNAAALDSGGGFYGEGALRLREFSKVLIENASAQKGHGGGFYVMGDADISDGGQIRVQNARSAKSGGGFLAGLGLQLADHSTVGIQHATAGDSGGGFQAEKHVRVTNSSTISLQNAKAGNNGGGFNADGEVEIAGSSIVNVSNSQAVSGYGGGFAAGGALNMFNGSTMIILNATAGGRLGGGGFYAPGRVAISTSTVSIQHARAVGIGGGFLAAHEVVIAQRSNVSISDAVTASQGGGFHAQRRLQVISQSILNIQNVKAGKNGGGFSAFKEVEIAGSSTVKISNSQAVSGGGGGLAVSGSMNVSTASTLMILNATALGGAGFYATGKVAIDNSTVNIQHAKSAGFAGGFDAKDEVVIAGRSQVSIWDAAAAESGGGFQVRKHLQVTNKSTLNLQDVKAGKNGGGLSASREVEITGNSTLKIWNSRAVSGIGGGFDTQELRVSNSSLIILNATAGTYGGGVCAQRRVTLHSSTVSIQSTNAGKLGGGFTVADEILIADMSNVTISDAVAKKGGGFHVEKRLQMRSHSTLNLENVEAGDSGGGLYSLGEVDIGGSSTVKISNGHAVSGYGGGFDVWAELKLSNRSTLIVLNVTAGINGGGVSAGGKVAINNSTVSIQNATSGQSGGGFFANGGMALVDASIVAMSDTHAGVDGGGFMVRTALTMHNGSMSTANSSAERTGTAGRVDGLVLLLSQSSLDIHQAEGDGNSSVLAASCLQLHPSSTLALEGVIGGHGLDLQNGGCSSLCRNTTFQVTDGAALNAMGRLSSGLLSVEACPSEEVRLSSIHLGSWNSSLLTTRPSYVVIDNVDIHYRPPVDNLQILAAQENFIINSLAISCPDCPQGVTFNATDDKTLQALSPQNLQCSKASTVSNGLTLRCDCGDYRITSEHFRNTELVSLEDVFQTCRFCNRQSYFQDGICHPCEIYRAWSDGKRDVCHWLPRERPERVILFTGAAVLVILIFIVFEILHAPLVVLDARSDLEDSSEVATKRIFTISVQGPITSLPESISRLVHQRVHYRARGTSLQWLDVDQQKPKAVKVCSVAQRKLLLQDAHVPFDCASCRGSLHATETCFLFTLLIALLVLLLILPTIIKVAVMSGNRLEHTSVTAVFYIALPMAVVAAVLHWPVAWLIQRLYRRTPFSEALDDYQKQIHCKPHPGPDATHPHNQGLLVLTLRGLWKHFESFILERNMHFVVANLVRPLTQSKGVSFVTLWGGMQVDYFVSHSWGTSFSHFVRSIRCHALSKEGPTSWIDAAYWICSFANNQWNIAAELADDPMDSAFARALRGGIKGVAMVLDREVQPLTRVWCLFEFLLSSQEHLELVFTTDVGVVGDDGCKSFDIALEVGKKIECLEVVKCQASSEEDKRKIFEYIINTLGSLESMDGRIKHLMGQMLKKNLANVGSATDSLLHRLGQN